MRERFADPGRTVAGSRFTVVCNGFADGPAQALRDHLVAEGARSVVMVSHPLTPEGGAGHRVEVHHRGEVERRTVRAPHRPPFTYPLDVVVPIRVPPCDLWVGFNPLAALRGLAERSIGRADRVVTWNVDFVPDRFGPGAVTRAYDVIDGLVARRADARVELSEHAHRGRDQRLGLDAGRAAPVSVVPMGAWIARVPTTAAGASGKAGAFRLAYLGHLVDRQGVGTLVEALALLRSSGLDVRADVVGGGPMLELLRGDASARGIRDAVEFHGFVESSAEVERILADCHLGVAPYVDDGTSFTRFADPGKLKAYAAAGLPMVVTPVPPNAAELATCGAARIVRDTPESVAEGIRSWATDPARWDLGRLAALAYAERFDWGVLFSRWLLGLGFRSDGRRQS